MSDLVAINSVIYEEPEWARTKRDILNCDVPVVFVDRAGYGSLAQAYNQGFDTLIDAYPNLKYIWFVSNVFFTRNTLTHLVSAMEKTGYDCIHPCFTSDHLFCRCKYHNPTIQPVPFVEFTAPIVRVDTFKKIRLDEDMPFWGHDFDWGYRVRQAGGTVAIHNGVSVKHEYIRFKVKREPLEVTKKRRQLRLDSNAATEQRLIKLYGENYRDTLNVAGFK